MCGIVGYITLKDETNVYSKDKFFTEALFTDTLRGADSTGIVTIKEDFYWHWQKQAIDGTEFIQGKGFSDRDMKTWCAIGHNRAATVGKVDTDNAHPFQHGPIILVHNGTLRSTYNFEHKNPDIKVDSEMIAYNLSKESVEDAHKVLEKLNGAYALVWLDNRDESVNFVRNSDRPMHISPNKDEDCLFFSSDGNLLNFVGSRIQSSSCRPTRIWQIATHQHLKYKKGSLVPEVATITPFIPRVYNQAGRTGGSRGYGTQYLDAENRRGGTENYWAHPKPGGRVAMAGRVFIAGEVRTIPAAHKTMLEQWYSFVLGEEYMFCPEEFVGFGKSIDGIIYGKVWHPEWQAWIKASVPECTFLSMRNYGPNWTAIPVGVNHTDREGGKNELTIMMRIKHYSWKGELPETSHTCEELDEEVEKGLVQGPHGEITVRAWVKLCEDGCAMCGGPLFLEDHDVMLWIGEMQNQPMCPGCFDSATIGSKDAEYNHTH